MADNLGGERVRADPAAGDDDVMGDSRDGLVSNWRRRLTEPLAPARARQIRLHIALIPVYAWLLVAWSAYAIDISPAGRLDRSGHIKGHDFVHFYVLGQVALDGAPDDLYSFDAQAARTDRLVPQYEDRFLPVHGPQVALFFALLAWLPYGTALAVWIVLSAVVYSTCCWAVWSALPNLRSRGWLVALFCAGSPAFYALVTFGQTSAFALAWFTLAFLALQNGRTWLAGLALGALVYKPTLGLVLPFVFLYARQWKVVLGAMTSAALQFSVAGACLGASAILGYVGNASNAVTFRSLLDSRPWLMHSLNSFFSLLIPWPTLATALYVATAAVVTVIAVRTWKTAAPLELRYAVLLFATVLVDPHVYSYELVVLVPAFMAVASWAVGQGRADPRLFGLLYLCCFAPALDTLTSVTRVQWSVPALVVLTVALARSAHSIPVRATSGDAA